MSRPASLSQSPLALLAGIVVVVALLTWIGGWALPLVIFLIITMVMGHEFGHFITAKRAGLLVTDFFVGFGPVVWSTQRGETRYGVRALLLGGYVKVPGMTWGIPVDPAIEIAPTAKPPTRRRSSSPRPVRSCTGSWRCSSPGPPSPLSAHRRRATSGCSRFLPWQGHQENAAQLAGLKVGDQIVAIDGTKITNPTQLANLVHQSTGKRFTLLVDRDGHELDAARDARQRATIKEGGRAAVQGRLYRHRRGGVDRPRVTARGDPERSTGGLDHCRRVPRDHSRLLAR